MKLSEQLEKDHKSGDFGLALEGYSSRAEKLENALWDSYYHDACKWGCDNEKAKEFADKRFSEI